MAARKRWRWIAAVIVTGLCLMGKACPEMTGWLKEAVKPPAVEIKEVVLSSLSRQGVTFIVSAAITNPNAVSLTLGRLEYQLEVEGHGLAAGTVSSPFRLKARGTSVVSVPVEVSFGGLEKIYEENREADKVNYALLGTAYVDTPAGDLPLPFEERGQLPLVRPPELLSVGMRVEEISLAGAQVTVQLELKNPNGFALGVKNFSYVLALEGQEFSRGKMEDKIIPPRAVGLLDIPLSLNAASGLSWALSLISQKQASYRLEFEAIYIVDHREIRQKETTEGAVDFGKNK